MEFIRPLPDAKEIKSKYALSPKQQMARDKIIKELFNILGGVSSKKFLCIGPCSADREDAVLDYCVRLAELQEKVKKTLLLIPRIYTSKPRTNSCGYKGLLHRVNPGDGYDNLYEGILATRKLHWLIINETGLFGADEMLYPEAHYYIADLLAYTAVGARSVENQQHRLVASGMDMPVGTKNPTSGDTNVMLNAIQAAQAEQYLAYHGWECKTTGNPYAHAILRGYTDRVGNVFPNYHYENLCELHDLYVKKNLKNIGVIIDCNHNNSNKHYDEQIRIGQEIFDLCRMSKDINSFVKGLMIESYLEDGSQIIGNGIYGKSITDPCLGWEKTEGFVLSLSEKVY